MSQRNKTHKSSGLLASLAHQAELYLNRMKGLLDKVDNVCLKGPDNKMAIAKKKEE